MYFLRKDMLFQIKKIQIPKFQICRKAAVPTGSREPAPVRTGTGGTGTRNRTGGTGTEPKERKKERKERNHCFGTIEHFLSPMDMKISEVCTEFNYLSI